MVDQHPVGVRLRSVDAGRRPHDGDGAVRLGGPHHERAGFADDLPDRSRGQPAPFVHDHHVRAGLLDLAEKVAGQDHGPPVGRVPQQDVAHLPDLRRVQAVHRLVEHQQVGQAEHRLRDGEPLAHAARVGAHLAVDGRAQACDLQHLREVGAVVGPPGRAPVQAEVVPPGQVRQEAGAFHEGAEPG